MPEKIKISGRIISIDYGKRRTGIAVTDVNQIIATGLTTVASKSLIRFLKDYFNKEPVIEIVLGYPTNLDGSSTDATPLVQKIFRQLQKIFPEKNVVLLDERLTSKMAFESIAKSGMPKNKRQNKGLVDEVSATILLQDYLLRKND